MAQRSDHAKQLCFGVFSWHSGNETDKPWHRFLLFLGSFRGCLDPAGIPVLAKRPKMFRNGIRNAVYQPMMETRAQRHPAKGRQRNVVARDVYALKPISLLEFAKAVVLLIPIGEICVNQVANSPIGT